MPPRDWKPEYTWLVIAALVIIICNMLSANKAYGQQITMTDTLDAHGFVGVTRCDSSNRAYILIQSGRSEWETRMTILHEQIHSRQMTNHPGGCQAAETKYRTDPMFRFKMEAEAYCVDTDFEVNMDKRAWMLDQLALKLYDLYGKGQLLYTQGKKIVYDICNQLRGGTSEPP